MTAIIWEHWYKWYVTYKNASGETISQEWFDTFEDAKANARHWGAFIVVER